MTSHVVPAGRVAGLVGLAGLMEAMNCRAEKRKWYSVKYSKIVHKALRGIFYLNEKCCGVSTLGNNALD